MSIGISWGIGKGVDGREAAYNAMQRVLKQANTGKAALALVFVSLEYDLDSVLAGLRSMLGSVPVWGVSTTQPITADGDQPRSVLIGLLTGPEVKAQTIWLPEYAKDAASAARSLSKQLDEISFSPNGMIFTLDGLSGDSAPVMAALANRNFVSAGCLAGGDIQMGKTFQMAGSQTGTGAMAAAVLGGRAKIYSAFGHGWKDVGVQFQVTRVRDLWIQNLQSAQHGDCTPAEAYEKVFGFPAREWAFPPLKEMARLYPLGIEEDGELVLRSPVHVEVNGSFRMNAPVKEGCTARVMVGDRSACLAAAAQTAREALAKLGKAKPLAAVLFVDQAWQQLFTGRSEAVAAAVAGVIGNVPVWGAYTLGQITSPPEGSGRVYNQNIMITIIGESER